MLCCSLQLLPDNEQSPLRKVGEGRVPEIPLKAPWQRRDDDDDGGANDKQRTKYKIPYETGHSVIVGEEL